jgi:hypothetical protein
MRIIVALSTAAVIYVRARWLVLPHSVLCRGILMGRRYLIVRTKVDIKSHKAQREMLKIISYERVGMETRGVIIAVPVQLQNNSQYLIQSKTPTGALK